jgi:hypothetical protein
MYFWLNKDEMNIHVKQSDWLYNQACNSPGYRQGISDSVIPGTEIQDWVIHSLWSMSGMHQTRVQSNLGLSVCSRVWCVSAIDQSERMVQPCILVPRIIKFGFGACLCIVTSKFAWTIQYKPTLETEYDSMWFRDKSIEACKLFERFSLDINMGIFVEFSI